MVYSKVTASSSPPNPDLPAQTSSPALHSAGNLQPDYSRGFGSMNMEDILSNIYSDSDSFPPENNSVEGVKNGSKVVDEVWRDLVSGGAGWGEPSMTLEVFLAKAGVVNEEDVGVSEAVKIAPAPPPQPQTDMMNPATGVPAVQFPPVVCVQNGMGAGGFGMEFGNAAAAVAVAGAGAGAGGGCSGRGKRRATVEEAPLDKSTQQRQRRMIKNRESAARSRERKQAYTVELESQLSTLEDENAELLKEEAELKRQRYKQLMENLIPVAEKQKTPRVLRRVHSMNW